MVSPELLRRYPFFGGMEDAHLKAIAMITEEITFNKGDVIFCEGQSCSKLYILLEGDIDLYYAVKGEGNHAGKEFLVGEINPGEPFGISCIMEPYAASATARVGSAVCRVLVVDGVALRAMCDLNAQLGYLLMTKIAQAYKDRLHLSRIELAAARA